MAEQNKEMNEVINEIQTENANGVQNGASEVMNEPYTRRSGCTFYRSSSPVALMPVPIYARYYKMDHAKRGIAVILNHENFAPHLNQKRRYGTNVDCNNLEKVLTKLGFEVQSYYDQSVEEIHQIIDRVNKVDHNDSDCFLLACLSHGEQGILFAQDATYKPDILWSRFTADQCPSLAGKPKLFFIQACQGKRLDAGVMLRSQVDSSPSYKIPAHADFLIAYSTIPGFFSNLDRGPGSWFIRALCEQLTENGLSEDILTILTLVNQQVAVDFETSCPDDVEKHQRKQIPSVSYMLTRILVFSQKPQDE